MTPIDKSNISTIASEVKSLLRDGKEHVYNIIQTIANALNACVNYINSTSATLQSNENERISNENQRTTAEGQRTTNENQRITNENNRKTNAFFSVAKSTATDKVNLSYKNYSGTQVASVDIAASDTSNAGVMSSADKVKLNGIETGAQKNLTISQIKSGIGEATAASSGLMSTNQVESLEEIASKTIEAISLGTGKIDFINMDGENQFSMQAASQSKIGLMTASDKTKLNGIETGAQKNLTISQIKSGIGEATAASSGLMSAYYVSEIVKLLQYVNGMELTLLTGEEKTIELKMLKSISCRLISGDAGQYDTIDVNDSGIALTSSWYTEEFDTIQEQVVIKNVSGNNIKIEVLIR